MLSINIKQSERYLFIPCTQRSYLSKAHNTQCYLSTSYNHSANYSYLAHSVTIYQKLTSINLIQSQRYLFIPCTQRSYLSKAHKTQCYLSTSYNHSAIYSYLAHSVAIYQKLTIHRVIYQPHTIRAISIQTLHTA